MTDLEAAAATDRLLGYDVARATAIVGMVLINFPIFLASLDGEAGRPLAWIANLHFGRAAALFVTLAGVGVTLMSRGANPWHVRRTLFLRALFLFALGNLLILVWDIDILLCILPGYCRALHLVAEMGASDRDLPGRRRHSGAQHCLARQQVRLGRVVSMDGER